MAELHFLRPYWLVLLPAGIWLIWQLLRGRGEGGGWRGVVDAALRPHVLVNPAVLRESRWPLVVAVLAWALGVIGLSGPAWERLPVPAFRSEEALVVALDLSRSMDAADVEPSRLARAKLKLLDLLGRRAAGQTALVVFSSHAFTVTPLTTDTRTIAALVTAVTTQIMPSQGSSVSAGLGKAEALLQQTGLTQGDVLLITDADVTGDDVDLAGDLRDKGFRVSVLAVGTEQGAPIAREEGGFLTDDNGNVVVPQLDPRGLQRLAAAGGGRFARLAPDDRDLDALFPTSLAAGTALDQGGGESHQADVWRDRGLLLAVALLPLLALGFRRGWICAWLVFLALPVLVALPTARAEAFEWSDLWQRADQRGYEAMQANDAARAAALFKDPAWRGAAEYRADDFPASAATLDRLDTPDGNYNRGNALAKSGKIEDAIGAYERTLELDPNHEDARYNLGLLRDFLDKQQQQQQQQQQDENGENQEQQGDQQSDSQGDKNDQSDSDPSKQGDPSQQQQQANGDPSQPGDDSQSPEEETAEQNEQQQAANDAEQQAQQANAPQDVEHWASEQAAEQWLRRIPQDPGGLLRRKFLYQYQRLGVDQDGKPLADTEKKPW